MKKVLLDFDNTLVDFNALFYSSVKKKFGYDIDPYDCPKYSFSANWDYLGISKEESKNFYDVFSESKDFYKDAVFLKDYKKVTNQIKALKALGYKIVLDTKVLESTKHSKTSFAETNMKDLFDEIKFSQDLKSFKSFDYDVVFEDNPDYIKEYISQKPDGLVVLSKWKYNEFLLQDYPNNIITPSDNILERVKK